MVIKQPPDKSHFILPDLGEGVHEAELIRWRVSPGDRVEEHQTLAEMETDKALVEVPSPWSGVIKELRGTAGDIINVGSVLVTYDSGAEAGADGDPAGGSGASTNGDADAGTVVGSVDSTLTVSDAFTDRRSEETAGPASGKVLATPAVRRIASESGIDIGAVPGTGRGGRVTASDLRAFAGGRTAAPAAAAAAPVFHARPPIPIPADGIAERIPIRGVRRTIAAALDRSIKTAVHFTVVDEADVTTLDAKRTEYGQVLGRKLSLLPFLMVAVCQALRRHPGVNANIDDAKGEILIKSVINLGCAVDTEHGLMVPVIPAADTLSIVELSDTVATLAAACRDRTIERERLVGGTFTISNVGAYGGLFTTPIINYPEVGILAAGRAVERVLTRNGMFYAGRVLPLSMSCDHRVVDGAAATRFLTTVIDFLEDGAALVASTPAP